MPRQSRWLLGRCVSCQWEKKLSPLSGLCWHCNNAMLWDHYAHQRDTHGGGA